jgi:hypothetical protein
MYCEDNSIGEFFVTELAILLTGTHITLFRGMPPDKQPKILSDNYDENDGSNAPLGFRPHNSKKKVIQIINVHKCDETFREIATCKEIGRMVGLLTGWGSVRLAQDQVWAK